jgi:hypothetical protein
VAGGRRSAAAASTRARQAARVIVWSFSHYRLIQLILPSGVG